MPTSKFYVYRFIYSHAFTSVKHDICTCLLIKIDVFVYELHLVDMLVSLMLSVMFFSSMVTITRFGRKEFSFIWDGWVLIMP